MAKVLELPAEQRIVLRGISWETYEWLLADHEDRKVPRFAYDQGFLEVVMPSPEHERTAHVIALVVELVVGELGIDVEGLGSTTFRREDLVRGFEPDACFYFRNVEHIRGKRRIDLTVDPAPDLVVEIDITSPSLNKFPIYARLCVPEVWRYNGEKVEIFELEGGRYADILESGVLPPVKGDDLIRFIQESATLKRPEWMREVRRWAQEHGGNRNY